MTNTERKLLARGPIIWQGDLVTDCTAEWAGLILRAEWMDWRFWSWVVYDMQHEEKVVASSEVSGAVTLGGKAARVKAESVARNYIRIYSSLSCDCPMYKET